MYQSLLYYQGNHISFYKFLFNKNDFLIWDFPLYSFIVFVVSKLNFFLDINNNLIFSSKIVSLFFFYLGLFFLIQFLKIEFKKDINYFTFVLVILINPFTLFWSTSVNTETLLFFLICCSLYNFKKNIDNPNLYNLFFLLICSSLAMLIKIHLSFAFFFAIWVNYLNYNNVKNKILRTTTLILSLSLSLIWYLNINWPFEWSDNIINENVLTIYLSQMIKYMSPYYLVEILIKKIFFEMLSIIFIPFFILGVIFYFKKIRLALLIILFSIVITNYFLFYHSYYWVSIFPFYTLIIYFGFIYLKKKFEYFSDFAILHTCLFIFIIYYLVPPFFYQDFTYKYEINKVSELKPLFSLLDRNVNIENIEAAKIIQQNFDKKEILIIFSDYTQHLALPFFTNKQFKIIRCNKLKKNFKYYDSLYKNFVVDKSNCKLNKKGNPIFSNSKYYIY